MGTRSLTHVIQVHTDENGITIQSTRLTMFKKTDGQPKHMGLDILEFLNMDSNGEVGLYFGDVGCLSAQLIAHFKKSVGGVYIFPTDSTNCDEEYVYKIFVYPQPEGFKDKIILNCDKIRKDGSYELVFRGTPMEVLTKYYKL